MYGYHIYCNALIGMLEIIVLCFSMQEEIIIEHTNAKCHVWYILVWKHKILLSTLMPSVVYLHLWSAC